MLRIRVVQAQAPSEGDTIVTKTSYGMAAEALNLDPRQIGQAALQPLWDNNQKLELLRVACQVWSHRNMHIVYLHVIVSACVYATAYMYVDVGVHMRMCMCTHSHEMVVRRSVTL